MRTKDKNIVDLESLRLQNIKANREAMERLGITTAVKSVIQRTSPHGHQPQEKRKKPVPQKKTPTLPTRRSERLKKLEEKKKFQKFSEKNKIEIEGDQYDTDDEKVDDKKQMIVNVISDKLGSVQVIGGLRRSVRILEKEGAVFNMVSDGPVETAALQILKDIKDEERAEFQELYQLSILRYNTLSKGQLIFRIRRIKNLLKLKAFIKVCIDKNNEELLKNAMIKYEKLASPSE